MRSWSRTAGIAAIVAVFFGTTGFALAQRPPAKKAPAKKPTVASAPASTDRSLADDGTGSPARPVDILSVTGPEATHLVPLWRVGPGDYSGAASVDLLLATYNTHPEVLKAELRVGTCVFKLLAPVTLQDNSSLALVRDRPCKDKSSASAELWMVARGTGRIAWWTWEMPATTSVKYQGLTMTAPEAKSKTRSIVRGRLHSKLR